MRNQTKVNHNHVHAAFDFDGKVGTIFDERIDDVERAGYVSGAFNVDDKGIVWYKTVGCCGFEFIRVPRAEILAIASLIRELQKLDKEMRNANGIASLLMGGRSQLYYNWKRHLDSYFNYTDEDRANTPDWDNGTCTRNARLAKESHVNFVARIVYGC